VFPGHLNALGALPMRVHVGRECVCLVHLSALGSLPMGVHVGLECALVT
jgi:hypothetical protein